MKKIIERRYKDVGQKWEEITLVQAIHDLESGGYWKTGTTKAMLSEGTELWTPFAQYRMKGSQSINGLENTSQNIEKELRLEIKRHLDKCDPRIMPKVCDTLKASGGYEAIEQRIIRMVIRDQITPSAAISHLELEG